MVDVETDLVLKAVGLFDFKGLEGLIGNICWFQKMQVLSIGKGKRRGASMVELFNDNTLHYYLYNNYALLKPFFH